MPRLAWFSPMPPSRSGIAAYSREILPLIAPVHRVDVFTAGAERGAGDGHPPVFEAHDFVWKHFTEPYDLIVYQLGNALCHSFMWPFMFRYPGLVVLHDGQLHHSRAHQLLTRGRVADYRAEFTANHPRAPEEAAEMVVYDLADTVYYFWPMLRLVVQSARLVAVHSRRLAIDLAGEFDREVMPIRMGVRDPHARLAEPHAGGDPVAALRAGGQAIRARHAIPPDAVVFAAFGFITPEKRISPILRAMRSVINAAPSARLLLVGDLAPHYDAMTEARALGVADHVVITGYVPDDEIASHLAASDVGLCLRWPTGRETSASWIRALASGLPTVVIELAHTDEMACLDPRSWTTQRAADGAGASESPAGVAIDIVDEQHSLRLAMSRLAKDAPLRERLGDAARAHWERHHTLAVMAADYGSVIERALARPAAPPQELPAHLQVDGSERARQLLDATGVDVDFLRRRR